MTLANRNGMTVAGQTDQDARTQDQMREEVSKDKSRVRKPTARELLEVQAKKEAEIDEHRRIHAEAIRALAPVYIAMTNQLQQIITSWNALQGFWESENVGEKFALIHSEVSEALEADRKDLPSDKILGYTGVEEELADVEIRRLDFGGHFRLNLGKAMIAKLLHNLDRPYKHGKSY